jgi:hypothetical protein
MIKKIRMSALTTKSEKILLKKLDLIDLRTMAYLSSDVMKGNATLEQFRAKELEMITKYGLTVK